MEENPQQNPEEITIDFVALGLEGKSQIFFTSITKFVFFEGISSKIIIMLNNTPYRLIATIGTNDFYAKFLIGTFKKNFDSFCYLSGENQIFLLQLEKNIDMSRLHAYHDYKNH